MNPSGQSSSVATPHGLYFLPEAGVIPAFWFVPVPIQPPGITEHSSAASPEK